MSFTKSDEGPRILKQENYRSGDAQERERRKRDREERERNNRPSQPHPTERPVKKESSN